MEVILAHAARNLLIAEDAEEEPRRARRRLTGSVTSSCLCKYGEGAGFPFQIESLEDGVNDSIHTFYVHKTHHGPGATPHFHETTLDHVGGAQFPPQWARTPAANAPGSCETPSPPGPDSRPSTSLGRWSSLLRSPTSVLSLEYCASCAPNSADAAPADKRWGSPPLNQDNRR